MNATDSAPRYASFTIRMMASSLDLGLVLMVALPLVDLIVAQLFAPLDENALMTALGALNLKIDDAHPLSVFWQLSHSSDLWKVIRQQHVIERMIVENLLQVGFIGLYTLPFWFRYSTTPGKMLFRLVIQDAKTGAPMSRRQSVERFLGYIFSTVPFSLGFIWVSLNKKCRGWHDYIAGTVVVVRAKKPKVIPTEGIG